MAPSLCADCGINRALILRPKNHQKLCKDCFLTVFETEIHHTITTHHLFTRGERVAIGASGGKDSTVLASVLKTLNERYDYGVEFVLLSIDEGIRGYRDDSLETVKRNAEQYGMGLKIVGYEELYGGWTMDKVVGVVGKKGNCTFCGVFRRQALDRGAVMLGVGHVVTGHNADDVAETVLMNLLRGDLPRLSRSTSIITSTPAAAAAAAEDLANGQAPALTNIKRSKPLKYAYEKEIVLYAHYKKLDYFSTECIYSPEAFRGSARALIKNLERVRPSAILDVVRSGEDMARLVPGYEESCLGSCTGHTVIAATAETEEEGGCGSANGRSTGGEMATMEQNLVQTEIAELEGLETEIKLPPPKTTKSTRKERQREKKPHVEQARQAPKKQTMGQCEKCGYLTSQALCKACVLLEGLNKNNPKVEMGVEKKEDVPENESLEEKLTRSMAHMGMG